MPNIKAKIKNVELIEKQNAYNSARKTRVKTAVKKFNSAIDAKDVEGAEKLMVEAVSTIDKAYSDGVYHKNTVARKKASLAKSLNNIK